MFIKTYVNIKPSIKKEEEIKVEESLEIKDEQPVVQQKYKIVFPIQKEEILDNQEEDVE